MIRQSFMRGRRRKALAAATIALAASLITALMNLSIGVGDKMAKEMKSYGANITLAPNGDSMPLEIGGVDYNPLKGQVFLEEKDLPKILDIFWRNNILGFAPFLRIPAELDGPGRRPAGLIGTRFELPLPGEEDFRVGVKAINPFWRVDGRWPEDGERTGVLAGATLARELGLAPGGEVRLKLPRPVRLSVVGILSTGGPEDAALVAPLPLVQELAGLPGKLQTVSVSAMTVPEDGLSRKTRDDPDTLSSLEYDRWYCTAYVSSIAHQLEEALPNAAARPIWQVAAGEGAVIDKIQLLMIVVTIAVFIASALGISSLMVTTIMERSREIGLMKALGASEAEVHALFLTESAIVGAGGGVAGGLAGAAVSQVIGFSVFGSTVPFHFVTIPVVVFISILIALAGSIMPSRLIARLDPAEVLHGRR